MAKKTRAQQKRDDRNERFTRLIAEAGTGRDEAGASWDWVRAEMAALAKQNPDEADRAWRAIAADLRQIVRDIVTRSG